jgi:hypothetical protein
MLLAALLATSQVLYVADTTTFGCSSLVEVATLQRLRPARQAFQTELYEQIFAGQCVVITRGKVVEGSINAGDSFVLLVDRRIEPPGFMAPLRDFHKLKAPNARK